MSTGDDDNDDGVSSYEDEPAVEAELEEAAPAEPDVDEPEPDPDEPEPEPPSEELDPPDPLSEEEPDAAPADAPAPARLSVR